MARPSGVLAALGRDDQRRRQINPRSGDPAYLEASRQALYTDVPMEEYVRFAALCTPDLPVAVACGTVDRWGRIPRIFIRTAQDHTIDRMIADADELTPGNRFDVRTLPSSHSPFASMPDRLARELAR